MKKKLLLVSLLACLPLLAGACSDDDTVSTPGRGGSGGSSASGGTGGRGGSDGASGSTGGISSDGRGGMGTSGCGPVVPAPGTIGCDGQIIGNGGSSGDPDAGDSGADIGPDGGDASALDGGLL